MLDGSGLKTGVYVDVANIVMNGGYRMQFDVLREFACRDGSAPLRLNAYVVYDEQKAQEDAEYRRRINTYHAAVRDIGFKAIEKKLRWYTDESGSRYSKANTDLDMAVDALMESRNLDKVVLLTGDGDFVRVVKALQTNGCRVEVLAFKNISLDLKRESDLFVSGYMVPNLLPLAANEGMRWGEIGSRVRGYCYHYDEDKGFGFMRFLRTINDKLHVTDGRMPESPFGTSFFHVSYLPEDFDTRRLPSRDHFFEFTLERQTDERKKDPIAVDIVSMV